MTEQMTPPGGAVEDKGLRAGVLDLASATVDAPMIVVGHHGEGPLHGALIGATANKLLHQSERPILVVPADGD